MYWRNYIPVLDGRGEGALARLELLGQSECRPYEPRGYRFHNLLVYLIDAQVAFNQHQAIRFACGNLAVFLPHTPIEGVLFGFEAGLVGSVLLGAALIAASRAVERVFKAWQKQ